MNLESGTSHGTLKCNKYTKLSSAEGKLKLEVGERAGVLLSQPNRINMTDRITLRPNQLDVH